MDKKWFVNLQINTQFLETLKGTGTWENPIGAKVNWSNNLRIAAVSDDPSDGIVVDTEANLTLNARKDDYITILWILSEVNPLFLDYRSVVMYNFHINGGATIPINESRYSDTHVTNSEFTAICNSFNAEYEPQGTYLKCSQSVISIPQTTVKANAKTSSITCQMKLLLVNIEDSTNPKILKYLQVAPTINIRSNIEDVASN